MTDKIQEKVPAFVKELWTGAMDLFSKTEKDVHDFVSQMIKKGKLTPEEGKKIMKELMEKIQSSRSKIEARAHDSIEKTLHMINLPTKQEVEELGKKVTGLTRRVNKLKKEIAA